MSCAPTAACVPSATACSPTCTTPTASGVSPTTAPQRLRAASTKLQRVGSVSSGRGAASSSAQLPAQSGRAGSSSSLLSPLRLAVRAGLRDAHVFFSAVRCADPRLPGRGRPSRSSAQTPRRGRSAAWRVRASSPPIPVPCGMAGSLRDWQPHGRAVARVGVYGGALERRCVPSGRADPLCGSMYGVWVPDTCGPFHTRIASKSVQSVVDNRFRREDKPYCGMVSL